MDTTELEFYHGTSAHAAVAILSDGARDPFRELRAYEFAQKMWPLIVKAAGGFYETASLFDRVGSSYCQSAPVALKSICEKNGASTFSYGYFYVSSGLEKASDYALRNRSGSELLLFIEEAIKVMRMLDRSLIDKLCAAYPTLMAYFDKPKHPVVLVLCGLETNRLADEGGGAPNLDLLKLQLEFKGRKGIQIDPSFRVANVTTEDVVAVYDLQTIANENSLATWHRNLNEFPSTTEKIKKLRTDSFEWLSNYSASTI